MLENSEWETFEFADSPKWDKCFDDNKQGIHVAVSTEEWEDIEAREAVGDRKLQERSRSHRKSHPLVTALCHAQSMETDSICVTTTDPECSFLFENPANPSNVWACSRVPLGSSRIRHVDVVIGQMVNRQE